MADQHYFSRYYKGEDEAPKTLSDKGRFFWDYEKTFYQHNPNLTQDEWDKWLKEMLEEYFPFKMAMGYMSPEVARKVIEGWKHDYYNS